MEAIILEKNNMRRPFEVNLDGWVDRTVNAIREQVGTDKVVCGLSGRLSAVSLSAFS